MNLPIEFEKKMKAFLGDEWDDFLYSYDNNLSLIHISEPTRH